MCLADSEVHDLFTLQAVGNGNAGTNPQVYRSLRNMTIVRITEDECRSVIARGSLGRLGCCLENQPYIVPVFYAFDAGDIYVFSTFGQKIEWMRANPSVCLQVDEIVDPVHWVSVIANGTYEELPDAEDPDDRNHARRLLEKKHEWSINALAERRSRVDDLQIAPLFFRIHTTSMSGVRATAGEGVTA